MLTPGSEQKLKPLRCCRRRRRRATQGRGQHTYMNRQQRRAGIKAGQPVTRAASPALHRVFAAALQHHLSGRLEDAEALFRQALALDPRHADTLHMLGVIAYQSGRTAEAEALLRKAMAINPNEPTLHSSLGNVLQPQARSAEAEACYRKAVALRPDFAAAWTNLANTHKARGQFEQAFAAYAKSLALDPDNADTRHLRGMALLSSGDLLRGWAELEWRWRLPQSMAGRHAFAQPQWYGEAGSGGTLLLHAEQGLGDTLQFCRFAPMAAARGWRVAIEAPAPLVRLLRSLDGVAEVVTAGEALPAYDAHCPMMSLPHAFDTTLDSVPAAIPYLRPDPEQVAGWRARLDAAGASGLLVGLVWAGGAHLENIKAAMTDRRRSIPPHHLAPLSAVPGVQFVSLQKEGPPAPPAFPLLSFMDEVTDFADTAALAANLDLVISVDTSTLHLAGAIGKPVWMLDRSDPCWRWMTGRTDSPWYPKLRIFRQTSPGDWPGVVARVVNALPAFLAARGTATIASL